MTNLAIARANRSAQYFVMAELESARETLAQQEPTMGSARRE